MKTNMVVKSQGTFAMSGMEFDGIHYVNALIIIFYITLTCFGTCRAFRKFYGHFLRT